MSFREVLTLRIKWTQDQLVQSSSIGLIGVTSVDGSNATSPYLFPTLAMCITSISICLWLISAFCLLFSPPALEMRKCTLWYLQMCTCINICDICRCASVWIPVHQCASASMPPCCYERLGGPLGVQLPQTEGFPQHHHQFNEQRCLLVLLCSLKY